MDVLPARGERTKHQIPNTKLQRNPKPQIPKAVAGAALELGTWCFFGVWSLVFGALIGYWDFPSPRPSGAGQVSSGTPFCRINAAFHLATERRIQAAAKNSKLEARAAVWSLALGISLVFG